MGLAIQLTKCGETTEPMNAPIAIEMSELMMRLRSSMRGSKKVIWPPVSVSGAARVESGWLLVVMGCVGGDGVRRIVRFRLGGFCGGAGYRFPNRCNYRFRLRCSYGLAVGGGLP